MKAELCPVCQGKGGAIPNWDCWDYKTLVRCHGCGGRGWVEVSEDVKIPPKKVIMEVNGQSNNKA
jgi:DnaJ-class molecular chaperone